MESEGEKLSLAVYFKGCTKSEECNKDSCQAFLQNPEIEQISKCEVNCCSDDLCNGAKLPMTNGSILLACALVAFFYVA